MPHSCSLPFAETLSTLKFANRAKRIRNQARVNEDLDQRTLLRKYERALTRLRQEVQQRHVDLVDKRQLLAVRYSRCPTMHINLELSSRQNSDPHSVLQYCSVLLTFLGSFARILSTACHACSWKSRGGVQRRTGWLQ